MINKETYLKGLKLICLDAGLEFSGEKGDQLLKGKITLFENFLQDFTNEDFEKATLEIIRKETFYNKIPQVKVFIEYCQKEKDKRLSVLKSQETLEIKEDMENVIDTIINYLDLKPSDRLYHYVKNELKNQNKDKIREAFKKLKDKKDATPDDWRRELGKKEVTKEAKNWVMPNLKANRI